MNKAISVFSMSLPSDIKLSLERIVDQLEKNNYAIVSNPNVKRIFSRFIPSNYKTNGIVYIDRTTIVIDPKYCVKRCGQFSFKIKNK